MRREILLAICICLTVAGIVILWFIKPDVSPQYLSISGKITNIDERQNVAFVTFVPDDFLVVSFDKIPQTGKATLIGRLQNYNGKVEFVVHDVR